MVLCEFYPKPKCPLPFPLPPELKCRLCPWAACTFAKGGGGMGGGIARPLPLAKVENIAQNTKIKNMYIICLKCRHKK